ncbi:hypothetical protein F5050DRAFT_1388193 [Lentinula boryana]|uniref:SWIM-type domain-containing protein n=1 Tax=Lentinula boryana TaxID=40481 RepID=A0ABQ8QGJ8_9AGAR|nr:hypothetical protein F5050DRAFT_1388193 [Lentinula boryana]
MSHHQRPLAPTVIIAKFHRHCRTPTMVNDKLAEFNGIKPNFTLAEGEEKVVKSRSIGLTYTIKRNAEHFYCTCPAWRNQIGVPINARSCKHFLSLLGEQYEEARLECMNPGGPPPKGLLSVQRPKAQNPEKTRSVSQKISSDKPSSESSSLKAQASLKPVSNSASANTAIVSTNPMSAYSSQPIPTSAATTQKGEISSSGLLNVIEAKVQAKKREREKQGKRNMVDDDDMMDMAEDEDDKMDEVGGPDEDFDMEEDDENYDEDEKFKSRKHKPFSSASSTIKKTPVKRKRADRSPDSDDDEKDVIQSKMKFTAKSSSSTQKRTSPASAKRPAKRRNDVPETQDDDDNRDKDEEPDKPRKRTTTKTSSSSKEKSPAKKPNNQREREISTEARVVQSKGSRNPLIETIIQKASKESSSIRN